MRAMRERKGYSQEDLAHQLNLSQSCVSKFENDRKTPDLTTFMLWAEQTCAKEVAIAFLYGIDGVTILQSIMQVITGYIRIFQF